VDDRLPYDPREKSPPFERTEYLDPNERAPAGGGQPAKRIRRWFRITRFLVDPDGNRQLLFVRQTKHGTADGAPVLQDGYNYYGNNATRELRYIIAPGAIVVDATYGINEDDYHVLNNTLILQRNGDFDNPRYRFERGDCIEQAIGSQPWNPRGFRVRHFNSFSGRALNLNDASFEGRNEGISPVDVGLLLAGGGLHVSKAKSIFTKAGEGGNVAYLTGIGFAGVMKTGIDFSAEMPVASQSIPFMGIGYFWEDDERHVDLRQTDAGLAIVFNQTNNKSEKDTSISKEYRNVNRKVIAWTSASGDGYATFGYNPNNYRYQLRGAQAVEFGSMYSDSARTSSLTFVRGISSTPKPANNVGGTKTVRADMLKSVREHPDDSTSRILKWEVDISFATAEDIDGGPTSEPKYTAMITLSWLTAYAIKSKRHNGFTIEFDREAPDPSTINWFIFYGRNE
jgi:hypothetical protein